MNKKILIISCFMILFISACSRNEFKDIRINEIKSVEKTSSVSKTEIKKELSKEETKQTPKKELKTTQKITQDNNHIENHVTIEESPPEVKDVVDKQHPDYQIHKGRIDCQNEKECMEISLPLQFKYKEIIANTFYTEVIAENNKLLGYFIEYIFKENQYATIDDCKEVGKAISDNLMDRITNYECTEDAILKIKTDY